MPGVIPFPGLLQDEHHGGPISCSGERAAQRCDLEVLSRSRDRGETDRARAIRLTLSGWTSPRIAEAFGVREDTVRLWRSAFLKGGVAALHKSVALGPVPVKGECALAVAEEVLSGPVGGIETILQRCTGHCVIWAGRPRCRGSSAIVTYSRTAGCD